MAAYMLKSKEVAEMLGVTTATLLRWRNEGTAPRHVRLPSGIVRFRIEDVEKWLKRNEGR